ncbi:MAG: hypothetical protein JXL81_03980, partial [Deltaproteobacteria bacterium]|nr:hypothetical protein [Deltaproteobacteria bacterium]
MRRFFQVIVFTIVSMTFLAAGSTHAQTLSTNSGTDTRESIHVPLPIEVFTKYDVFTDIKLSPSGKYAAYLG